MIDIENDVLEQVRERIKKLLFNESVIEYREHEKFRSHSNHVYCFLIWKLIWENQIQQEKSHADAVKDLVLEKGYQFLPGGFEMLTCDPTKNVCYKVIALYKV